MNLAHFRYWLKLTSEEVSPEKDAKGKPFSMQQLRFLLNTCRVPGIEKDFVRCDFAVDGESNVHFGRNCMNPADPAPAQ